MRRLTATIVAVTLSVPAGLGLLSADAAAPVVSALSLNGPASAHYGTTQTMTGLLRRHQTSTPIPGATVYLQRSDHNVGNWTTVASRVTGGDGRFSVPVQQSTLHDYRAVFRATSTYTGALSGVVHTITIPVISIRIFSNGNGGERLGVAATIYPAPPLGKAVYLQRLDDNQVWRTIGFGRVTDDGSGADYRTGDALILALLPPSVASYRLVLPAQGGYAEAVTSARQHTHDVFRPPVVTATGGSPGTTVRDPEPDTDLFRTLYIRGGASAVGWFDLNTSGCNRISYWWSGQGSRVRVTVRSGDAVLHTQEGTAGGDGFRPVIQQLNGQGIVRFEFADVTASALNAHIQLEAACITW